MNSKIIAASGLGFIIIFTIFYTLQNDTDVRNSVRESLIEMELKEPTSRPYSQSDNTPQAYFAHQTSINKIIAVDPRSLSVDLKPLPNELLILPGHYTFQDLNYNLTTEGLYRFYLPEIENQQRIVFNGNVDSLESSIAWIYSHGNSDNDKSIKELHDKALHSKIFGTCDNISHWIKYILDDHQIESRVVQTLTAENWNSYNNGHTMIEIYRPDLNKWVLYDLDNNAYFSANQIPLSLLEFHKAVGKDNYNIHFVADDTKNDISNFKENNGYDYAFISESINSNEDTLRDWYHRVIQVIIIPDTDNNYYFYDQKHRERIESYSNQYKFLEYEEFIQIFYDQDTSQNGN